MPTPYSQDPLTGPYVEHRRFLSDRSRSCAGSNCPSLQLTVWNVVRLPEDTPTKPSSATLGRLPDMSWRRCPGRPRNRWLEQLHRYNSTPPADLWRRAVTREHSGVTLQSWMTMCLCVTQHIIGDFRDESFQVITCTSTVSLTCKSFKHIRIEHK